VKLFKYAIRIIWNKASSYKAILNITHTKSLKLSCRVGSKEVRLVDVVEASLNKTLNLLSVSPFYSYKTTNIKWL
jgi:hypothetical protein